MDRYLTTEEAAKISCVSRQSVYLAIKKNRLKAEKLGPWFYKIKESDLAEYRKNKYCRDKSTFAGKPLYDVRNGEYSLKRAAEYLGIPYMSLYFQMRSGKINATRKGAAWIFRKKDLDDWIEKHGVSSEAATGAVI